MEDHDHVIWSCRLKQYVAEEQDREMKENEAQARRSQLYVPGRR